MIRVEINGKIGARRGQANEGAYSLRSGLRAGKGTQQAQQFDLVTTNTATKTIVETSATSTLVGPTATKTVVGTLLPTENNKTSIHVERNATATVGLRSTIKNEATTVAVSAEIEGFKSQIQEKTVEIEGFKSQIQEKTVEIEGFKSLILEKDQLISGLELELSSIKELLTKS